MIKIAKCLGIDLGATSVKIAQVERVSTGVKVSKLAWGARSEGEDTAAVIRNLIKANGFSAKHAIFSLYGHQVFLRVLTIPRSTEDRIRRIVMYEAKQQIPFPYEEAVVDYQIFDTGDPGELYVMLGAVRRSTVNDLITIAERCGLSPVGVTVSTVALFNYYALEGLPLKDFEAEIGLHTAPSRKRSSLSKMFSKKRNAAAAAAAEVLAQEEENPSFDSMMNERVVCQVNLGASSIDMVISRFSDGRCRVGFPRSIPEGLFLVDHQLEKQLGMPLQQAIELRTQQGMVLSTGSETMAQDLDKNQQVSELLTRWADRLAINLRKTCDYYMSLPDGSPVDEVVLSGGGSSLLNLTEYLEERLGIPVRLKTESESPNITAAVAENLGVYVECIGLALDGLGFGRVRIDFLPTDLQSLRDFSRHKIEATAIVALLIAVLGVGAMVGNNQTQARRLWLNREQSNIVNIRNIKQQLDAARGDRQKVSDHLSSVVGGLQDRMYWLDFLTFLTNATPSDVTVTKLELFADGHALVEFNTSSLESRNVFESALAAGKEWVLGRPVSQEKFVSANLSAQSGVSKNYAMNITLKHKTTRLKDARETLLPGLLAPTATPEAAANSGGAAGAGPMMGADQPLF